MAYERQNDYDTFGARVFRPGSIQRKLRRDAGQERYESSLASYQGYAFVNRFADLQNPYENLTVNTQAFDLQTANTRQNLVDVMDATASRGGTQTAGQLQSLLNATNQQTQRASAGVGAQEQRNQMTKLGYEGQLQQLEAKGQTAMDQMEFNRLSTILGIDQAEVAGAYADIASVRNANGQVMGDVGATLGQLGIMAMSDKRLKKKIVKLKVTDSGIPVYKFSYIGDDSAYEGVMAQDLLSIGRNDAVTTMDNGYYAVLYDRIDADFKLLANGSR